MGFYKSRNTKFIIINTYTYSFILVYENTYWRREGVLPRLAFQNFLYSSHDFQKKIIIIKKKKKNLKFNSS